MKKDDRIMYVLVFVGRILFMTCCAQNRISPMYIMKFTQNIREAINGTGTLVSRLHTPARRRKHINVLVILCCLISLMLSPAAEPVTFLPDQDIFHYISLMGSDPIKQQ